MSQIIENRNKFIEQHKIKKILRGECKINLLLNIEFFGVQKCFEHYPIFKDLIFRLKYFIFYDNCTYADHIEVYETYDNKIIILSSPYQHKDDKYLEFIEKNKFIDTDSLYVNGSVSFYKVFDKSEITIRNLTQKIKSLKCDNPQTENY